MWPTLLVGTLIAILVWTVSLERTLYYWDETTFWFFSAWLSEQLKIDVGVAWNDFQLLLSTGEYNMVPSVAPAMAAMALGQGRTVFVGAIAVFYLLPFVWIWLGLQQKVLKEKSGWLLLGTSVVPLALSPNLWQPIRYGYPDIGALALCFVALLIYFGSNTRQINWRSIVMIGISIGAAVLFRRWYAFWVLSFLVAIGVDILITNWNRKPAKAFGLAFQFCTAIAIICFLFMSVVAWPTPLRMLTTNYSSLYVAYQKGSWLVSTWTSITNIVVQFGVSIIAVSVACIIALWRDQPAFRRPLALVVGITCLAVPLFSRTNVIVGQHHIYMVLPAVLLPIGLWLANRPERRLGVGLRIAVVLLLTVNIVTTIKPNTKAEAASNWSVFSGVVNGHKNRPDMDELQRLFRVLDDQMRQRPGDVYVLSSSTVLNFTHLRGAELSMKGNYMFPNRTLAAAELDRRDGFPRGLLVADFVIVCTPTQYHLEPQHQHIIGDAADSFMNNRDIGQAFMKRPEVFALEEGVTAYLFERIRRNTNGDVMEFSNRLRTIYPNEPFVYSPR